MNHFVKIPSAILLFASGALSAEKEDRTIQETLPPLQEGGAAESFESMWGDFDPRAEPLDVEILNEWEEDGVVLKVLRYRIGIFKGQKAMMAAIYGYPKEGTKLPGLVQIHGGGQYAHSNAVLTNAKRGYATISISWAGRISAPNYKVSPNEVKLFWENKTEDPSYKLTTDWGALDAYHAPSKYGKDAFVSIPTAPWTLDAVESPRNSSWFPCTLGARRALTFLEQQSEVDPTKLGVYGHSMGGKLTVLTTGSDPRVKAAAPSCGGISDRYNKNPLHRNTVGDAPSLKNISCPIIFLSPSNDFHGHINDLPSAIHEMKTKQWRVTCSPHASHQDLPAFEVATQLWFDQHLKGNFSWPETPTTSLTLKTSDGVPSIAVKVDASHPILEVDVYYTQQGIEGGDRSIRLNRINRFWHHAAATNSGDTWTASLPLFSTDKPLWVYANVSYKLDHPVSGAGYYYGDYTTDKFNLSSLVELISPEKLQSAGVKPSLKPELMIESFDGDWEKEWFTYKPDQWERKTHKLYHPRWAAQKGARLSLDVLSSEAQTLVVEIDGFTAKAALANQGDWQTFTFSPSDFKDTDKQPMKDWTGLMQLRLGGKQTKGTSPKFRNLQWIKP